LVIVAAFTEKPMMDDAMDIQLIEKRITVLEEKSAITCRAEEGRNTQSPSIQKQ
jgi:hypothetical protein